MKIVGIQSGHDISYCILENGIPILHEEQERFSRVKMELGDGLKFFFSRQKDFEDIKYFCLGNFGGRSGPWKDSCADSDSEIAMNKILEENDGKFYEFGHHLCHASNAFYSSDFDKSLIVTVDGGGREQDGTITSLTISEGIGNKINRIKIFPIQEINLGTLWYRTTKEVFGLSSGYPKGDQAGTVMAMATLGNPKYADLFANFDSNVDVLKQISYKSEQDQFDVASSLQKYTEDTFVRFVGEYIKNSQHENICFSGGVSLNCVMIGKIKKWFPNIKNVFCDPVPYDAGLAIGSARYLWHHVLDNPRIQNVPQNSSSYLGIKYTREQVDQALENYKDTCSKKIVKDKEVLEKILEQKIVAVFGGGSESGRRALGNRSILVDPRNESMKKILNDRVKHRQWYRPFAPSILEDKVEEWFEEKYLSPYMSFAVNFKEEVKDKVPAVVHYDGTGRLQTVRKELNNWYYNFIKQWEEITGVPILLNTSFNDSEPIVETPDDALKCFMRTNIDYLYFFDYNILVEKI